MTTDMIEKFVESEDHKGHLINIHFKQRNTVTGLFIDTNDYKDLKTKNFWRIVPKTNVEQWRKTRNLNLAKIFSGTEFTKLAEAKNQ